MSEDRRIQVANRIRLNEIAIEATFCRQILVRITHASLPVIGSVGRGTYEEVVHDRSTVGYSSESTMQSQSERTRNLFFSPILVTEWPDGPVASHFDRPLSMSVRSHIES